MEENLNKVSWSIEVSMAGAFFDWPQNLVDQDEYPAAQQIHERCIVSRILSVGSYLSLLSSALLTPLPSQ
jgi:hypothetical protein